MEMEMEMEMEINVEPSAFQSFEKLFYLLYFQLIYYLPSLQTYFQICHLMPLKSDGQHNPLLILLLDFLDY